MEPFAGENGQALHDEALGLDNAMGARAEEECYAGVASDTEVEILGSFGVSINGQTADHNGEWEDSVAEDKVTVGGSDLGVGTLDGVVDAGGGGDLFLNEMVNGNDAAALGSLEVSMGATVEEELSCETGKSLGDEENIALDQGIKVSYEQRLGEDGEIDKIEVSGDGISLFVEFSGTVTKNSGFHVSMKSEHENSEMEEHEECGSFYVGDVVWVKTKSQSWWPGKILDPSGAAVDATEADRGHLLVAYLGSSHVSWCLTSQLKAFHKIYTEMLKKNKSRNFKGAVDKAVHEFGKRVMEKLTSKREKYSTSLLDELGECCSILLDPGEFLLKLKFLAVNLTRPNVLDFTVMMNYMSAFYGSIGHENKPMHLLLPGANPDNDVNEIPRKRSSGLKNRPGKNKFDNGEIGSGVENVGTGTGTGDLTSPLLDGDGDETINRKSDLGSESRSRKKSKYLSYPYVHYGNREPTYETEEKISSHGSNEAAAVVISMNEFVGSPSIVKCTGKKLLGIQLKEFESPPDILSFGSNGFLAEIGSLALDCTDESDKIHMTEWFSYKLRSYLFHDQHIYETYVKNVSDQEYSSDDMSSLAVTAELKESGRRAKRIPDTEDGSNKTKPLSGLSDVNIRYDAYDYQKEGLPDLNCGTVLGNPTLDQPKKRRKRRANADNQSRNATEAEFDQQDFMSNNGIKLGSTAMEMMMSNSGGRKQTKKLKSSNGSLPSTAAVAPQAAEQGSLSLPDLNGHQGTNSLTASVGNMNSIQYVPQPSESSTRPGDNH